MPPLLRHIAVDFSQHEAQRVLAVKFLFDHRIELSCYFEELSAKRNRVSWYMRPRPRSLELLPWVDLYNGPELDGLGAALEIEHDLDPLTLEIVMGEIRPAVRGVVERAFDAFKLYGPGVSLPLIFHPDLPNTEACAVLYTHVASMGVPYLLTRGGAGSSGTLAKLEPLS